MLKRSARLENNIFDCELSPFKVLSSLGDCDIGGKGMIRLYVRRSYQQLEGISQLFVLLFSLCVQDSPMSL